MKFVRTYKRKIQSDPKILFRKPWLLFVMPIILINVVQNRLKKTKTVVYLTETNIANITGNYQEEKNINYRIRLVSKIEDCISILDKRVAEDPDTNSTYYNTVSKRFQKGDFAFISFNKENDPISILFIGIKEVYISPVEMRIPLPEHTFGIYDVYSFISFRGQGHYRLLFHYAVNYMQNNGYRYIWLWLMSHNVVSIKAHFQLGLKHVIMTLTERICYGFVSRKSDAVDFYLSDLIMNEE